MVDLTERQRRVLGALDFPAPCTVVIGGTVARECEQVAAWQMVCKGCRHRSLVCEEHHALVTGSSTRWQCSKCRHEGVLADVFVFDRIRAVRS